MSSSSQSQESPRGLPPGSRSARVVDRLTRGSFIIGAAGLLLAMAVDATAVLGRHLGIPLLGSIELVQACVVLMGSSAIVGTTLRGRHASVHLLTDRLPPGPRKGLLRIGHFLSALFFGVIGGGTLIVLRDLWGGDERSELIGLPYAPLRLFFIASVCLVVCLFLGTALRLRAVTGGHDA